MTRPRKNTVDYFPHECQQGKTIFILEQNFQNDGYSTWFKVLEELGKTENHYLDLNNKAYFQYLVARLRVSGEKTLAILDLLSELEAIDKKLWSKKIVWSDNFITGIQDVYKKRTTETPLKPSFRTENPKSEGVSGNENPQSKVKESKVKESIKGGKPPLDFSKAKKEIHSCLLDFAEQRKKMRVPLTQKAVDLIIGKLADFTAEESKAALEEAIERGWRGIFPKKITKKITNPFK